MLNRTLRVLVLGIAALSTYAADSLAATTTTTQAACVTRPPKVWKSTGGTSGLCVNTTVGSIDFEFLADEFFNFITVNLTPTSDTVYVRVRNKKGHYPPGQNPTVINGVVFDHEDSELSCTTGPGILNVDTGLYEGHCTILDLSPQQIAELLPRKSIPKGLIADEIILAGFDVEIIVDGLTFRETDTNTTTVHFEIPEPPIIGADGTVTNPEYSADESESDSPPPACGEGVPSGTFYPDTDGDGFGDPNGATSVCLDEGFSENATDCDDSDPDINPSATEVLDGADNNCDTKTDDCVSILKHCSPTLGSPIEDPNVVLQTFCGAGSHSEEIDSYTRDNASYVLLEPEVASVTITSCDDAEMTETITDSNPNFCALTGGSGPGPGEPGEAPRFNDRLCDLNITPY